MMRAPGLTGNASISRLVWSAFFLTKEVRMWNLSSGGTEGI
jgi:hypothetical protein